MSLRGSGMPYELDRIDREIIAALRADGRMSVMVLAETVQVSRANAYARVERLRRDGVIRGFTVSVDADKEGLHTDDVTATERTMGEYVVMSGHQSATWSRSSIDYVVTSSNVTT